MAKETVTWRSNFYTQQNISYLTNYILKDSK